VKLKAESMKRASILLVVLPLLAGCGSSSSATAGVNKTVCLTTASGQNFCGQSASAYCVHYTTVYTLEQGTVVEQCDEFRSAKAALNQEAVGFKGLGPSMTAEIKAQDQSTLAQARANGVYVKTS
jgi:uncharacterized protein YceK